MFKDPSSTEIYFEEKHNRKKPMFLQGIDDHKNFFLLLDYSRSKKEDKKIWKLVIKDGQLF